MSDDETEDYAEPVISTSIPNYYDPFAQRIQAFENLALAAAGIDCEPTKKICIEMLGVILRSLSDPQSKLKSVK